MRAKRDVSAFEDGPGLYALLHGTYLGLGITDRDRFLRCHRPNGGDPVLASLVAAVDHTAKSVLQIVAKRVVAAGLDPVVTGRLLDGIRREVEDATAGWAQKAKVA